MFGHSDDEHKNDHDAPQHDAVLGSDPNTVHPDQSLPQPHDDGVVSPAFTSSAPSVSAPVVNDDNHDDHGPEPTHHDAPDADTSKPAAHGDLLSLKQSALQQLSPLVGHLDQTPEEKFRTTMMMIQANDDQSLLKEAYETAQKITDEKIKAQALLDVINEINYFTSKDK